MTQLLASNKSSIYALVVRWSYQNTLQTNTEGFSEGLPDPIWSACQSDYGVAATISSELFRIWTGSWYQTRSAGSLASDLGACIRLSSPPGRKTPGKSKGPSRSNAYWTQFHSTNTFNHNVTSPESTTITFTSETPSLTIKTTHTIGTNESKRERERELCFNCDEKFTRGHRCAS